MPRSDKMININFQGDVHNDESFSSLTGCVACCLSAGPRYKHVQESHSGTAEDG